MSRESLPLRVGDLVQSCPPNLTRICIWSFNHRGNNNPFPVRSYPLHCYSSSTALPLPPTPAAGFSPIPVPVNSYIVSYPLSLPFPLLHPQRSPDLSGILNGTDPSHPVHSSSQANRTVPAVLQFGSMPSHVGNGLPSGSQISSQSSSLSSVLPMGNLQNSTSSQRPCPRQLPSPLS